MTLYYILKEFKFTSLVIHMKKDMGKIIFIEHNGAEHPVEIDQGNSLMELALYNAVPGIDADCGGGCACGTCHVIIEDKWFKQSGEILETESQMLDMTPERETTSRLSCQIKVTDAMDGMKVRLPEFQM